MNAPAYRSFTLSKLVRRLIFGCALVLCLFSINSCQQKPEQIRIGVFKVDATPPIGSPVAYAPARSITDSLSARGIVILSDKKPIVICAVDWLGIANEGQERWKKQLAEAANTSTDRVSAHALRQHDGMRRDFTTESILAEYGLGGTRYDTTFLVKTIQNAANAVRLAVKQAKPVPHIGFGEAMVEKVVSNRRILGEDGKVEIIRYSKSTDSLAIAVPEGVIDPRLKSVSFWNEDEGFAVMTYYATHPQSYNGEGDVTCEFVGIARNAREKVLGNVPHIHFTGAAGNVAAGKYNDGSAAMRSVLTKRMETAMKQAWDQTTKIPVTTEDLAWKSVTVALPVGKHVNGVDLRAILASEKANAEEKFAAAKHLAWLKWTQAGNTTEVSSLRLANMWLLNLPGELFVEYQLAAQAMRPDDHVCTAAYEEYGPGYIGTKISYSQGGYETQERVSPEVEQILLNAIKKVLQH